jgi:uncharacterized membrane protein
MNKSTIRALGLCLIVIAGLILRLLHLDKPEGLWFDEYTSWQIASTPLMQGFVSKVKSQCHMPFYYFYLKAFMLVFGRSDILLRLTSVIPGVASIFVMYFVGKNAAGMVTPVCEDSADEVTHDDDNVTADEISSAEANAYRTGIFCAGFTAISSLLIFVSQEVRFYSLLFLFSALALLYAVRLAKVQSRKNLRGFLIANSLIILTHTIGFVFVFFNMLALSIYLRRKHRKIITTLWKGISILLLCCTPLILKTFTEQSFSQFWEKGFTPTKLLLITTDYFSPLLKNLTNTPVDFRINPVFFRFAIIPSAAAIFFMLKTAFTKFRAFAYLFGVVLGTLAVMSAAAMTGKMVLLTKYTIEVYPILILLVCAGAASFEIKWGKWDKWNRWGKWVRNLIVAGYCIFSVWFILDNNASVLKIHKSNGHKLVADLLNGARMQKGDMIFMEYYYRVNFQNILISLIIQFRHLFTKATFLRFLRQTPNTTMFTKTERKYIDRYLCRRRMSITQI